MISVKMKLRDKVQIEGVPVIWVTNLEDDDIRALYTVLSSDPEFGQSGVKVQGLAVSLSLFDKTVPFGDGFCRCFGFSHKLWVTYRSKKDWELWNARQVEIKELKEEQAEQKGIEKLLFRTTDRHLRVEALEALQKGRFEEAALHIEHRFDHARRIEQEFEENFGVKWLGYSYAVCSEVLRLFCCFPKTVLAIAFLEKNANHWDKFFRFAESYEIWSRFSKEDLFNEIDSYHFANRTPKEVVFGEID